MGFALHNILKIVPFKFLELLGNKRLIILYYHLVSNEEVPHIKNLYEYKNINRFSADLDFILENYTPIRLVDLIGAIRGQSSLKKNCFILTFDDGLTEISEIIAPILFSKGVPASFFISSAFLDNKELCYLHKKSLLIEELRRGVSALKEKKIREALSFDAVSELKNRILSIDYKKSHLLDEIADILSFDFKAYLSEKRPYVTSSQILELINKGFEIGAHSIDHPYYSTLSLDQQIHQTLSSMKKIREEFRLNYGAFAFPHNNTGVSFDFFRRIEESGIIDICFGTDGNLPSLRKNHFQRISLEKPNLPAKDILKYHYARNFYKKYYF